MILFAVYAVFFWLLVFHYRRQWQGYLILTLSVLPLLMLTTVIAWASRSPDSPGANFVLKNLAGYGAVLHLVSGFYAGLILLVGLVIVTQHRRSVGIQCLHCGYDLTGNETGVCPECGRTLHADVLNRLISTPRTEPALRLPTYDSEQDADRAGRRSIRRPHRLPDHLAHRTNASSARAAAATDDHKPE